MSNKKHLNGDNVLSISRHEYYALWTVLHYLNDDYSDECPHQSLRTLRFLYEKRLGGTVNIRPDVATENE